MGVEEVERALERREAFWQRIKEEYEYLGIGKDFKRPYTLGEKPPSSFEDFQEKEAKKIIEIGKVIKERWDDLFLTGGKINNIDRFMEVYSESEALGKKIKQNMKCFESSSQEGSDKEFGRAMAQDFINSKRQEGLLDYFLEVFPAHTSEENKCREGADDDGAHWAEGPWGWVLMMGVALVVIYLIRAFK